MKSGISKFFAWIVVFLLIVGLAGFGLQDVISRWGSSKIAKVGTIEVSSEDFQRSFINELNYISNMLDKPLSIEEARKMGLHISVANRLINQSLLEQLLLDFRISTSDATLMRAMKANSNFKDPSGEFSRSEYKNYLDRLNLSENDFEANLRKDLTRTLLTNIFQNNFIRTPNSNQLIAEYIGESREILVYKAKDNLIKVEKNPNEDEVTNFYNTYKERYTKENYQVFNVLVLDPNDMAKTLVIPEEELLQVFQSSINRFETKKKMRLNKIVFSDYEEAKLSYQEIISGEKTFQKISETKNLSKDETYLGVLSKEDLEIKASDLIFDANRKKGDVVGPIEGPLGFEIYKVDKIIPGAKADFEVAREIIKKEIAENEVQEKIEMLVPEINDRIAAGETLAEIRDQFLLPLESIEVSMQKELPEKFNYTNFATLVTTNSGDTSDLIELPSGLLVATELESEHQARIPSLKEIADLITDDLYKEKKLEALREFVDDYLSNLSNTHPVDEKIFDLLLTEQVKRGVSIDYLTEATIQSIFTGNTGDLLFQPVKNTRIPYLLAIKIGETTPISDDKLSFDKITANVSSQIGEEIANETIFAFLNSLNEIYKPAINTQLIEQLISGLR